MDTKNDVEIAFVNALKALDADKEYEFEQMYQKALRESLVYDHYVVPVGLHYYGITDDLDRRKRGSYKGISLQPYIDTYGWKNITTTIVADGLTRKEAEVLENDLIKEGWKRGDCINKQGSGGEYRDNPSEYRKQRRQEHIEEYLEKERKAHEKYRKREKEYGKQYREEHKEEKKEYNKKYYKLTSSAPEFKIYNRVKSFNKIHPDRMIETPKEARQKYLDTGYIPNYIKNNDLVFDYNEYYIKALRDIAETVLDMRFDENNEPIVEPNEEYNG